ncbi:ATP-NAD kinase [Yamadazyma tenuis ATCC 10573]|uniref:ATP-NAD kinase n=2 Tax=Candida tenuis TaxID=2315449 RepID=G3BA24_CANTC|nr:ATP-NAD kinase [Yamadazyma tenuis ATCC 10573]EGV62742.1 ATP-NAD kinase [Yamadazyma tenuis ATCC 10573]
MTAKDSDILLDTTTEADMAIAVSPKSTAIEPTKEAPLVPSSPVAVAPGSAVSRKPSGGAHKNGVRKHRKSLREGGSSSRSTSPDGSSIRRVPPKIHNKLYCEQVNKIKRAPSTVLNKLNHDELKSVRSHTELAETANGVRMLARNLSKATIHLDVKTIMVVTKARDNSLIFLTREVVEWFLKRNKNITIYVDSKLEASKRFNYSGLVESVPTARQYVKFWTKEFTINNPEIFDLVLTLGGDGTVLYVSNLFQRIVPPVISFALGSLGFLTNFRFDDFRSKMLSVLESGVRANLRMRFTARVHRSDGQLVCEQQVLNELVVDRGPSPYVTNLELYGDGSLLTIAQADGLIIATPTGSTAYSLSAGGSLVHPGVSAISVTPICPHTLSFRPILLPDGMFLKVKVPFASRSTAWASFDGKVRTELLQGDYVTIQASPFPFPTVISSKTEYIDSVSRNLHWNVRKQQRPFSDYKLNDSNEDVESQIESLSLNASITIDNDNADYDINFSDENPEENTSQYSSSTRNSSGRVGIPIPVTTTAPASTTPQSATVTDASTTTSKNLNDYPLRVNTAQFTPNGTNVNASDCSEIGTGMSTPSDTEEDIPFLPSLGGGLSTPPSHTISYTNLEDRHCFAHPNAHVTFGSSSSDNSGHSNFL